MDLALLDDSDSGDRLERFVTLLGIEPASAGTFFVQPGGDLAEAWRIWIEETFLPVLLPAYRDAHACGISSQTRELHEVDEALDRKLGDRARERSLAAAAPFFAGKTEMKGNREWKRFAEGVAAGESPGHLAVAHAVQSALYHVALGPAVESYAWFELRSREGRGIPGSPTSEEEDLFRAALPHLRVALFRDSGQDADPDETGDEPFFRVV